MRPIQKVVLAIWTGTIGVASLVVLVVAIQEPGSPVRPTAIALASWFPAVVTVLGVLIALRQPGNRIAWLLIGTGFAVLGEFFLQLYLGAEPVSPSSLDVVAIALVHITMPAAIYQLLLVAFLFPSGRFFTHRQIWAAWPGVIGLLAVLLMTISTEQIGPPFPAPGQAWTIANPVGFLPTSILDLTINLMIAVLILMALGGLLSLVVRYRGSSLVTKVQIRWMLFSTWIVGGVLVVIAITDASQKLTGGLFLTVAFVSVPISITVAITRYRMFEIDRIISRTVGYAVVIGGLALVYALGAVWLPAQLTGEQSPLFVAGATLAAAALFNPIRRRVLSRVDRRFNRSKYDAEEVIELFSERLRSHFELDALIEQTVRVIAATMQPSAIGAWVRGPDNGVPS